MILGLCHKVEMSRCDRCHAVTLSQVSRCHAVTLSQMSHKSTRNGSSMGNLCLTGRKGMCMPQSVVSECASRIVLIPWYVTLEPKSYVLRVVTPDTYP